MHLRRLLESLPQHRGMANALLQGDESFRPKLTALQAQIDQDMELLAQRVAAGDCWGVAVRVHRIQGAWSFITQQVNGFEPAESFARHTALVSEVLYLINDVADAAGLLALTGDSSRLIDAAINTLPQVTETLGQARGMGTGVAARGKCGTDMRVKLRYL
jgi:methyl-accepting chemotaxis protein